MLPKAFMDKLVCGYGFTTTSIERCVFSLGYVPKNGADGLQAVLCLTIFRSCGTVSILISNVCGSTPHPSLANRSLLAQGLGFGIPGQLCLGPSL